MTVPSDTPFSMALTCQKCGCHDDSVRQVIYPYVFSFIFITFRKEFHGRWCLKHRTFYLLLAAIISGTFGWLGFPFGLIYTPQTLFRLAKGSVMRKLSNVKLLRSLAEAHEERGLNAGALRCLEGSLQFVDDLWSRQEIGRYHALPGSNSYNRFSPPWLFAGAILLSGLAGFVSYYADKVFDLPTGYQIIFLGPLLLWMPLAVISLVVIFVLRQIQEKVLESHPYQNPILILGMAFLSGIVAAYSFLEGRQIGNFLNILQDQPILPTGAAFWNMLWSVFTRGGLLEIPQNLRWIEFWNFFHHLLLTAFPLIFPAVLVVAAWPYLHWEKLLKEIRSQRQNDWNNPTSLRFGKMAPFAAFIGLVGLLFVFPQQSLVDFIEARDHYIQGIEWTNNEDYEKALSEYKIAVQLDQHYALAYAEMGWAYYQLDDNQQAIAQYTRSLELDPNRAATHYELGRIYYFDDQLEKAEQELEATIQLDPAYTYAYLGLGWVAYDLGDLEKAESNFRKVLEFDKREYDAYVGLGYIYEDRGELDEEIAAYQQAVVSDPSSAEAHMLLGMALYDKNELDQAITSLKKAANLDQENQMVRF